MPAYMLILHKGQICSLPNLSTVLDDFDLEYSAAEFRSIFCSIEVEIDSPEIDVVLETPLLKEAISDPFVCNYFLFAC